MVREPQFAHYPRNMKFPKPIQNQMKLVDGLAAAWAEADSEYATREHLISQAKKADAEAREVSLRTVERFQQDVDEVRTKARQIEAARQEGLAPLRWVASLTDGNLSYDPSFPIQGGFQFPNTAEKKPLAIVELWGRFYPLTSDRSRAHNS